MIPSVQSYGAQADAWRLRSRALWLALAGAALAVGAWARFQTLDGRQWTTDEYFFLESVGYVLQSGVPAYPTGGYYMRGLVLQYLTAGLWLLTGESTATARAVSMFFGLGSIGLGYVYARRFVAWPGAVAVAMMLALSSWEIEFSGFARMYAALQFMTLAFLILVDRAFECTGRARFAPHLLLLAVALVHEQVVLLAPLLFLPLLSGRSPRPGLEFAAGLLASTAVAAFLEFDFRNFGEDDILPLDYDRDSAAQAAGLHSTVGNALWVPAFPFWSIGDPMADVLLVAAVLATGGGIWALLRRSGRVGLEQLWASWLLLAALLHQLVIAGIAGAVLVLRHDLYKRQAVSRATYAMVAGGVVAAAAWVAFALSDVQAWMAVVDPTDVPRTARLTFLALPNFFDPIIFPWREALPILGTAFVVALMGLAWRLRRAPVGRGPLAVVAVSLAILALVATPQLTTRYCFYLYPVLLTLLVQAIEEGARALRAPDLGGSGPAALALAIFAIGGDFHPGHIADVASQEASYRIGPWRRYEDLWYPRIDFRGPAEFLNQEIPAQRNEPVIVVGQDPVAHWLERPYAMYFRPNSSVFTYLGRKRGTIHLWSGRPIVATPEHVQALCARATTAWILRSVEPRRHGFNASEIWGARFIAERRAYVGEDGRLEVVRVSLTPSTAALAETGSRGQ